MTEVIDFFFQTLGSLWATIKSRWILCIFVLINVIGWVIDLVKASRQD